MPILSKNLTVTCRQLRTMSSRSRLEKAHLSGNAIMKSNSLHRGWPTREDSFAAAQIHKQRQPSRTWSTGLDIGMFRPVSLPDQGYVPALPSRNKTVAAQNSAKRRTISASYEDLSTGRRSDRRQETEAQRAAREAEMASEVQFQKQHQQQQHEYRMSDEELDAESELELRSVRETVFGPADDNEEDDRLRREADAELLQRVSAQNMHEQPAPTISRKVIQPYSSYRSHRTRWAEFRHGMIYGRSSF